MEFIDTHCHIHFSDYALDAEVVYKDSMASGVKAIICVGTTLDDSRRAIDFASAHPAAYAAVGVHPHDAASFLKTKANFGELLSSPKVVAVGELGLDYYKNYSAKTDQQATLRAQIEASLDRGLPYIFHVREAWEDFWKIFDDYPKLAGVIHSFSANESQLEQALSRNLLVGLNGIMTFTKDEAQLSAARQVPLGNLLLETDAPFLTPKPHRGEVCQPKHVIDTAKFLAQLRGQQLQDLAFASTANARELFELTTK